MASKLALVLALAACASGPSPTPTAPDAKLAAAQGDHRPQLSAADTAMLDDVERRTFDFFWNTADPTTGLVPDRAPTPSFSSIAAVGFGLTAYVIGVERGYVTRADARDRVLKVLRFFRDAPQGEAATGMTGHHGFYYHFLDMKTGQRYRDVELSSVDTALLMAGVMFAREYFDAPDEPNEAELRKIADALVERVEWTWMQPRAPHIAMGWQPEHGYLAYDWVGYNEAMLVLLLAMGSPTHPISDDAWQAWSANYDRTWGPAFGQTFLGFPPLFGHQYSQLWVDFRGIRDRYMQTRGFDYFENSRRATLAQRAYAIANPDKWTGYSADIWGLTACDGPGDLKLEGRTFHAYTARGMASIDDGTIAPTAMIGSIAFAPEVVLPGMRALLAQYGKQIYRAQGFVDAFNPSFPTTAKPGSGTVVAGAGWVAADYLGIDQGPIIGMIENYRTELVWRVMRKSAYLRRGLARAGFAGGWLNEARSDETAK